MNKTPIDNFLDSTKRIAPIAILIGIPVFFGCIVSVIYLAKTIYMVINL